MEIKRTLNNLVLIKLDAENEKVGGLFVDTTFNPEKHITVTGIVYGLPSKLKYCGKPNIDMPWLTPMEIKHGDSVIIYYLSIVNALKPKEGRCFIEDGERFVLIPYQFCYAVVRDGNIVPINGYCLLEPCENPETTRMKERMKSLGLEYVEGERKINNEVTYGIIRYAGVPNKEYVDFGATDRGVDVATGDVVVIKKTNDIPLQYNLHAKIDGGKPYLRVQRRNLLAKI